MILFLAMMLDYLVGYPAVLYQRVRHPVVAMGCMIGIGERLLNQPGFPIALRYFLGAFWVTLLLAAMVSVGIWLSGLLTGHLVIVEILLVSSLLAMKSLCDHVGAVENALRSSIADGRTAVGMIVGRNTDQMDEAEISRAAVESLAENFSDGVIGPALAWAFFGLPGILAYKMVSTADSMIGHKNEKYKAFGWAAARLDDLFNLVPARLTALLILIARPLSWRALAVVFRDAGKHASPNAGWPETAMASALSFRLGGPRRYHGKLYDGPWLGDGRIDLDADDIGNSLVVARRAYSLFAGLVGLTVLVDALH